MKLKKLAFPLFLLLVNLAFSAEQGKVEYIGDIACKAPNGKEKAKYAIVYQPTTTPTGGSALVQNFLSYDVIQIKPGKCSLSDTYAIDLEKPLDALALLKAIAQIDNLQYVIQPQIQYSPTPLFINLKNVSLDYLLEYIKALLKNNSKNVSIRLDKINKLLIVGSSNTVFVTAGLKPQEKTKACENPVYVNYIDLCTEKGCFRYSISFQENNIKFTKLWKCSNNKPIPLKGKQICSNTKVQKLNLSEIPIVDYLRLIEKLFDVKLIYNPQEISNIKGEPTLVKGIFKCLTLEKALDYLRKNYHFYIEKVNDYTYQIYKDRDNYLLVLQRVSNQVSKVFYIRKIKANQFAKLLDLYFRNKVVYSVDSTFNAVTVIASKETIKQIEKQFGIYIRNGENSDNLMSKIFYVKFGKPDDIVPKIQEYLSEKGSVQAIPDAGAIEITDYPTNIAMIENVFGKFLSQKPVKIKVTVRFVSISKDFARSLGFQWDMTYNGLSTGAKSLQSMQVTFNTNGISTNLSLLYKKINPLNLIISAGETLTLARTLASPSLILLNNQPGNITSGTQIPYQSVDQNGNPKTELINAAMSLQVTPQLLPDGRILLKLNLSKNAPNTALAVNGQPAINNFSIQQNIIVANGDTVVIGGILERTNQTGENGVPIIKEIPLLGWLFKNKNWQKSDKELMVFITAQVISD
jgi:hypothetical protein